jgi:hypothetical protein
MACEVAPGSGGKFNCVALGVALFKMRLRIRSSRPSVEPGREPAASWLDCMATSDRGSHQHSHLSRPDGGAEKVFSDLEDGTGRSARPSTTR